MAKDENDSKIKEKDENYKARSSKSKSKRKNYDSSSYDSSDPEHDDNHRSSRRRKKTKKRSRRRSSKYDESSSSSSYSDSESATESEDSVSEAERRERKRKREKERRKEKEKRREKEKMRKEKKKKKEKKKEKGKKGAVTNSWGKHGIIRETDMWNKRPEFTAWLLEVKQVNLETLANWEEKQMFKEFMEDHNTATFPSKKYYNLDAYHARKMEKELKKGLKKVTNAERTVFNDEEQRRLELQRARERQKEEEIEALKCSMQGGMAQAMKEQARLREEMAYQYRIGNHEAAAAIQRRLDPDVAMTHGVLIRAHSELGNKWSVIAKLLPGRTENSIKSRWNTNIRKQQQQ